MQASESYWTYRGPPRPDLADLPTGAVSGTDTDWRSLAPGLRRAIYREVILDDARRRALPEDVLARLRTALIDGTLRDLDAYLMAFDSEDARRAPLAEDAQRLRRADLKHAQSVAQISARETDFAAHQGGQKDG